jgi:DNA-binding LacI/PurR family transcriptional regulator
VPRRLTIRDVAREAGVSVTTVSDALSGRGRLPDATRARVRDVAERLGYRPSPTARRLRQGRTSTIGLYCPLITDVAGGIGALEYYMRVAMGAAQEALAHDLALVLLPPGAAGDGLGAIDVDGLLVVDPVVGDPALALVSARGVPVVTCELDPTPGAAHAGAVDSDHRAAVCGLLDLLAAEGAQRIALIAPTRATWWGAELQDGYAEWVARHGRMPLLREVHIAAIEQDVHAVAAELLRAEGADRPDAIVSAPEGGALGVLRAAAERGLDVPGELLVASCVESPVLATCVPPVTSIDLRPYELGLAGARLLARIVAGEPAPAQRERLGTDLVVRDSTRRRQSN